MRRSLLVVILGVLLAPTACDRSSSPPGALTVYWRVGGQSCLDAGIGDVDVELYTEDGELHDVMRARCTALQTRFPTVEKGTYSVYILGYPIYKEGTGAQITRADATYEGAFPEIRVRSGEEVRPAETIVLAGRKGQIFVNWKFENGMSCLANGIATVQLSLWDGFGNNILPSILTEEETDIFDCSLEEYAAKLPEEELRYGFRGVSLTSINAEPLTLEAVGYDIDNNITYFSREELELTAGEERDVILTLAPCYDQCH